MEPLSDEDLVVRYRSQTDPRVAEHYLNDLFQRHQGRVALWCLRITGDRNSAADLAQEVFLKAFRSLDSYRGDSKFSTWLYSITRNHCFNQIKSRSTIPEDLAQPVLEDLVDSAPGAQSQLEQEGNTRLIQELVRGNLTELETQVFTLFYAEELPLDSITRLLKLDNASGAKAYIVSAKRKLARAVERWKAREHRARP